MIDVLYIECSGTLRHCFHGGDTVATIAMDCGTNQNAQLVLKSLGSPWHAGKKNQRCVVAALTETDVEHFQERLEGWGFEREPCGSRHCSDQCRTDPIDDTNHSVDRGATWTVRIPVGAHPDQLDLLRAS